MQTSMSFAAEPPAKHSQSQDCAKDWMTRAETSCSPILPALHDIAPVGWFGKTCPASCPATEEGILQPSSGGWSGSGIMRPGECLTFSTGEHFDSRSPSHNGDAVCSLSDILETGDVPRRYYLTAKACRGILRRADKRGKRLPHLLVRALTAVAG